jgi:hypothetical protein
LAFDPNAIPEDQCITGHLDGDPIYEVLMAVGRSKVTGRLTIEDAAGENHMYFMQGQPVGVQLAEFIHPLGQLLLELGRVNGRGFVRAQRMLSSGGRLAGQVFKELGYLDEESLKEVLSVQARRKAEYFCRYGSRAFTFCRGLGFLSGFSATPLNVHAVIFLAVQQQMGPQSRQSWIDSRKAHEVKLERNGTEGLLPAPMSQYGFGPPEERFLQRIDSGFQSVDNLAETGTLPRDEMAVLLRYLELIGRLGTQAINKPRELTDDDVFSSSRPATAAPAGDPLAAGAFSEMTDPGRPSSDIHNVPTLLPKDPAAQPAGGPQMKSLLFPSESTLEEPAPAPKKKKKKKKRRRRAVPEPSVGTSAVSETKVEKDSEAAEQPSIVIDFGDDG